MAELNQEEINKINVLEMKAYHRLIDAEEIIRNNWRSGAQLKKNVRRHVNTTKSTRVWGSKSQKEGKFNKII